MQLVRIRRESCRDALLDGVFCISDEELDGIWQFAGKTISLGEVAGRNSDIEIMITIGMFQVISRDEEDIQKFKEWFEDGSLGFDWKSHLLDIVYDMAYDQGGLDCKHYDGEHMDKNRCDRGFSGEITQYYEAGWYDKQYQSPNGACPHE